MKNIRYVENHPRKVIGEPIHDGIGTKKKGEKIRKKLLREWHESLEDKRLKVFKEAMFREEVESTYLVPEIENFIETPCVKRIKDRVKMWLKVGYPVHIIGPTGCGKTTVAMQVAKELGRPVTWINGDEQVTTTDLIGGYSQVEVDSLRDKYIHNVFKFHDILKADWVDNPLTLACKHGYTLVYNEFSRTLPAANNVLLSVFEEKILELPTKFGEERYVKVHPDFAAVFTSNSIEYAGVHRPQDALLDRMVTVYMDYYDFDTEVKITKKHSGVSAEEAKKIVTVVRTLREKLEDVQKPGTRGCIIIAKGLVAMNGYSEKDFRQLCVDMITSKAKGMNDLVKKRAIVEEVIKGLN